jgi:RNA polymerase sigma factor (sigma-70 family)
MAAKNESYMVTNPTLYAQVYKDHYKTLRKQIARQLGSYAHHSLDELVDVALERACTQVELGLAPSRAAKSAVGNYRKSARYTNRSYDVIAESLEVEIEGEEGDFFTEQTFTPFATREISEYVNLNNYGEDPANQTAKQEVLAALETSLDTLPYPTSAVLSLYFLEEKKQYTISSILSLSAYKVASHLDKGIELLRENKQLVLKRRKK